MRKPHNYIYLFDYFYNCMNDEYLKISEHDDLLEEELFSGLCVSGLENEPEDLDSVRYPKEVTDILGHKMIDIVAEFIRKHHTNEELLAIYDNYEFKNDFIEKQINNTLLGRGDDLVHFSYRKNDKSFSHLGKDLTYCYHPNDLIINIIFDCISRECMWSNKCYTDGILLNQFIARCFKNGLLNYTHVFKLKNQKYFRYPNQAWSKRDSYDWNTKKVLKTDHFATTEYMSDKFGVSDYFEYKAICAAWNKVMSYEVFENISNSFFLPALQRHGFDTVFLSENPKKDLDFAENDNVISFILDYISEISIFELYSGYDLFVNTPTEDYFFSTYHIDYSSNIRIDRFELYKNLFNTLKDNSVPLPFRSIADLESEKLKAKPQKKRAKKDFRRIL